MLSPSALPSRLLDLLLPPCCLHCRARVARQGGLCADCWGSMHFLAAPCCPRCGHPYQAAAADGLLCGACLRRPPDFDRARAAFRYDDASKGLVLSFKHGDRPGLAAPLAGWLARAGADLLIGADLLAPVPLHPWRLFQRRYNQAALLAQALSRHCGARYAPDLLKRVRNTRPQGRLSPQQRRDNLRGAFCLGWPVERVAGRRVLLIDDVLTTGATIAGCVAPLRRAGASGIDVLTLARVVIPQ